MQIIANLEGTTRGPYHGCVAYLSFNGILDTCITLQRFVLPHRPLKVRSLSPAPEREGHERGGQKTERVRVIDWEQPANNDFLLVSQFSVTGALYTCRPDLVGFVNGLPLVAIGLKKPGVPARAVLDRGLTHYKEQMFPIVPLRSRRTGGAALFQRPAHRLERQEG